VLLSAQLRIEKTFFWNIPATVVRYRKLVPYVPYALQVSLVQCCGSGSGRIRIILEFLMEDGQLGRDMSDKLLPSKAANKLCHKRIFNYFLLSLYFQFLFSDPSIATGGVLALQAALVTGQLILLLRSHIWYHLLSQVSKCSAGSLSSSPLHRVRIQGGCSDPPPPPHPLQYQWPLVGPETGVHKITNVPIFLYGART
jgi:hypothetical protein